MLTREAFRVISENIAQKKYDKISSKNKGYIGIIAEDLLKLPRSTRILDFIDGGLKTFPLILDEDGILKPKETIAITMINSKDYTLSFDDSKLKLKLSQVIFLPILHVKNFFYFLNPILYCVSEHNDTFKQEYRECIGESLENFNHESDRLGCTTCKNRWLQIRTKGSTGSNTMAFYLTKNFIKDALIKNIPMDYVNIVNIVNSGKISENIKLETFIKWAGGKRKLLNNITPIIREKLKSKNIYIEPFLGGGSVLFELINENLLTDKQIYVNDACGSLIDCYIHCVKNLDKLLEEFDKMRITDIDENFYNNIRDEYNRLETSYRKTTLFIWLNNVCFNGLYRVNSRGYFNVPFGKKIDITDIWSDKRKKIIIFNNRCSKLNISFHKLDYREFLTKIRKKIPKESSISYFDPPYYKAFDSYTPGHFDSNELLEFLKNYEEKFILSNSGKLLELSISGRWKVKQLDNSYCIRPDEISNVKELIITNFEIIKEDHGDLISNIESITLVKELSEFLRKYNISGRSKLRKHNLDEFKKILIESLKQ